MAVSKNLIAEVIEHAQTIEGMEEKYTRALNLVMNVLEGVSPVLWCQIGHTVEQEGAFRLIGRLGVENHGSGAVLTNELFAAEDSTKVSEEV